MIILVIAVPLIVMIPISIIGTYYENKQQKEQSKQKNVQFHQGASEIVGC